MNDNESIVNIIQQTKPLTDVKKWNDEDLLEEIIKKEYEKEGKDPSKSLKLLEDQEIMKLKEWKKLTEEEKDKDGYPRGLRKLLDEVASVIFLFINFKG